MEPAKLEEYKDSTGIALLNAFNSGLLSREEFQLIQRFKREKWDDVDAFLRSVPPDIETAEDVEYTRNVESTEREASETTQSVESTQDVDSTEPVPSKDIVVVKEGTKDVESTKKVESSQKDTSYNVESTENAEPISASRQDLQTASYRQTDAPRSLLSSVNIRGNFTKLDNEVSDRLNPLQTPLEQSIYNRLYRLAVGWGRNYCRVSARKLSAACNVRDRRTLNAGLDGLIEKGHIQIINRNNRGVLYRVFLPQEIMDDSNTIIEMIPLDSESSLVEGAEYVESTKNVESTKSGGTAKNEDSTELPPFKDLKDNIKDSLYLDQIVTSFYRGIGQIRVSKTKRESAKVSIEELTEDGFSLEDIDFAVEWTLENAKEKLYDFSIIKHTIGQAMAAKSRTEAEEARRKEEERLAAERQIEEKKAEEEKARIDSHKEALNAEERKRLREKAEAEIRSSGQFKEEFITDHLIEAKENELIRQQMRMESSR